MSYANRTERLQRQIDDAIADGWRIESETPERVVLVKRNFGSLGVHLIIALLTGWWSFGVINLVYGAYKYLNDSQRRVLREGEACPECGASVSPSATYCQNCGTELPGTTVETETTSAS
ncbi:zinc ribbon domain-containing protein [Halorussus salinisoli]|uniref:zinc ribbon domain-containing protein n=1 Tax=Halorussus salinisoli TaxID=2558242 RepID=UPI0010C24713|nr:zinc ribbon domain-containing protein [Halorussus salinisoli]